MPAYCCAVVGDVVDASSVCMMPVCDNSVSIRTNQHLSVLHTWRGLLFDMYITDFGGTCELRA